MPKYLFKANNDVLSLCACTDEPALSAGQLDCPWCGCGWLIVCSNCRRAFTFAEVRTTDVSLTELGRREMPAAAEDEIAQWATEMAESLDSFDVGDTVVYLDGIYWTVGSTNIEFDGYFASHKLERLPHAAALHDPSILPSILGDRKYWLTRERPSRRPDMG